MNEENYLVEEYIQTGNNTALKQLLDLKPGLAHVKTSLNVSPLLLSCYYVYFQIETVFYLCISSFSWISFNFLFLRRFCTWVQKLCEEDKNNHLGFLISREFLLTR